MHMLMHMYNTCTCTAQCPRTLVRPKVFAVPEGGAGLRVAHVVQRQLGQRRRRGGRQLRGVASLVRRGAAGGGVGSKMGWAAGEDEATVAA